MTRKTGLGRGLNALIPGDDQPTTSGILHVSVQKIIPNPRQPRSDFSEEMLDELAESIREHGVLQPIIVSEDEEQSDLYVLIAGERRWLAAKKAGLEQVPVILREASDQQRLELALVENVQRSDLGPLETAEAYRQLAEDFQLSHDDVARRVFKSRSTVTNTLRLLKLPVDVRAALAKDQISEGHARALLGLPTPEAQSAALQTILARELNVRHTEELVKRLCGEQPAPSRTSQSSPEIEALEERLMSRLGTKVRLTKSKKGGTITIHYYSGEELNSLIEQLIGLE
jgi:ParB family transcriptional regulator, chromosome partitioning protein